MGEWIAVWPGGEAKFSNYGPAAQEARLHQYSKVIYRNTNSGLWVTVWPLDTI